MSMSSAWPGAGNSTKKRAAAWLKPSRRNRSSLIAWAAGERKAAEYSTSLTTLS
jgi:hypothetical protein